MALEAGAGIGGSLSWWDEEERKRKEKLGIAGAPIRPQASTTEYKPLAQRSQREVQQYAQQSFESIVNSKGYGQYAADDLKRWMKMEREVGQDTLTKRLSDVYSIWKSYLPTLKAKDAVWELVQSPYTLDEIEEMCRQAAMSDSRDLFRATAEKTVAEEKLNPNDPYAYLSIMKQRGYQPAGQSPIEKAGEKIANALGLIRNDDGTVNWGWTGVTGDVLRFWEHPNEVAAAAAVVLTGGAASGLAAPTLLGTTIGGVATGDAIAAAPSAASAVAKVGSSVAGKAIGAFGGMKAAGEVIGKLDASIGADVSAQEAAQKAMQAGQAQSKVYVVQRYNEMLGYTHKLDEASALDVQKSLQEDVRDEYGNYIRSGYGAELEAKGAWTNEWDEVLRQAVTDQVSRNIEAQRKWIEEGYAESYYTVDGNMDTEQWNRAAAIAMKAEMEIRQRQYDDPLYAAQVDMSGVPTSWTGVQAWFNRLKSEGIAQAPLKGMISVIGMLGGTYNGFLSSLEYSVKRDNDPIYQGLRQELNDYAVKSGKYTQQELMMLTTRYAFMDDELANGKLKDDTEAKNIAARIKQRSAQIIASGFEPSTFGIVGHTLGLPYDEVEKFKEDHETLDLGLNLIRDAFIAVKTGPAIRGLKKGKAIAATEEAFRGSDRAYNKIREATNHIRNDKPGLAQDTVRGSDASAVVEHLTSAYLGRNTKGGLWRNLAHDIRVDIENGDVAAAAAKLERGGVDATQAQAAAGKAQSVYNPTATPAKNIQRMASALAKEQKSGKSLLDLDRAATDKLTAAYVNGASVFPYFRAPELAGGGLNSVAHRSWLKMVNGIENPTLKNFLGKVTMRFERAPVEAQEYIAQEGPARIFEAAYAASDGNLSFALKARNRWTMARSQAQMDAVCESIKMEANRNFKLEKSSPPREVALSVDPLTGDTAKALADTGQAQYKGAFKDARRTIWAEKNLSQLEGANKIFAKVVGNPYRKFGWKMKKINDPLRRWTVGFPLLFTKHAIVDSTRTLIEEGTGAFVDAFRKSKNFEEALSKLSPDIANSVRANLHKSKMSEQHYNVGGHHAGTQDGGIAFDFEAKKIYEVDGKTGQLVEKNMAEGVEALRRIAIGKVFQKYAEGGQTAVFDWLQTTEGKKFLYSSGNVGVTKTYLEQMGVTLTGKDLMDAAVVDYWQRFGENYLEALDLSSPQIAAGLKEMALNNTPLTQANIKALVKRVNAQGIAENPYLSIPPDAVPGFGEKYFGKGSAARRTALFMTPNKWNREVLYKSSFTRFFKEMQKQGFEADAAAKVAMDLAELETARVHFDLANGLHFETQNRWFAWFGTKHRLYNSYLLKMASERPSIAGAAQTLLDYMEDKNNENPNGSEWDRFNFRIPVGWLTGHEGDEWTGNPATICWLADYPLESSTAQVVKIGGAAAVNALAGGDVIHQETGDYGLSSGRWDGITLTTTTMVVAAANYAMNRNATPQEQEEQLVSILGSKWMPDRVRKSIAKGMSLAQFEAIGRGEDLTPWQAFWKSGVSALMYEYIQLGKPISGRLRTANENEANTLMRQYDAVPVEKRPEWLVKNPQASAMFGMYSTNPAERMIVDRGWNVVQKATQARVADLDQAMSDGTIFDAAVVAEINRRYDEQIERLTDPDWRDPQTGEPAPEYNEYFTKVWKNSGYERFTREEGINILYPWVDAKAVSQQGYVPTQAQQDTQAAAYKEAYQREVSNRGWEGLATASPALFWLKNDMVTEPMRKFTKGAAEGEVPWASSSQESVASALARGEAGPSKKAAYLNEVHLRNMMAEYAAGTDSRAKKGVTMSAPLFSKMTTEQKTEIGWNSDKAAEYIWRRWAMQKAIQQVWMKQNGVSPSSTKAKQIASALDQWSMEQGQESATFRREYEFAKLPLHERLQEIGIGTTGKKSDQGWQEFFAIVTSYQADLASVGKEGVSPQAQKAAPITQAYLEQILALRDKEPDWWQEFSQMYTPSKFGFYWRLGDSRDSVLFGGEEQAEYDEQYDYEVY